MERKTAHDFDQELLILFDAYVHGERMITANYKPGFKAKLFKKDLGIATAALAEAGVPAITSSVVAQLVAAQIAAGRGEEDYSAIGDVIFELAHL